MALKRRLIRSQGLTQGERTHLATGADLGFQDCSFCSRDSAGQSQTDLDRLHAAWRANREALLAEAAEHGLIPWAARRFEAMVGKVHPYEHLMGRRPREN